ncbi:MAG: helix-turn-helix domain-containing protein [Anaeroplasmataceae bacterium]|nr:helix-turn-helix domain-containing protein [Anaeroplasmataceae bacterium]
MADKGTKFFSIKWGVSQTTISRWCREGKIPGATQDKLGSPWHIPENSIKPKTK